jgi:hypothetical protein
MNGESVVAFFYGSYIICNVLREVDLSPERFEVARRDRGLLGSQH